jgi:hypothetical protein
MSLLNGAWNLSRSVFYRDFVPTALRKFVALFFRGRGREREEFLI